MMQKIKEQKDALLKLLSRSKTVKEAITLEVRETLKGNGFRLIEDHAKKCIEDKYKSLLNCPKEKLETTQTEISVLLDFFNTIYSMAELKWEYDSHTDPSTLYQEKEDKYSIFETETNKYNAYLDKVANQEN